MHGTVTQGQCRSVVLSQNQWHDPQEGLHCGKCSVPAREAEFQGKACEFGGPDMLFGLRQCYSNEKPFIVRMAIWF